MIPVEKNQEYTTTITAVASDGNGIAKIDGYTVFVPHTITGDIVRILMVKVKSGYGYGKLVEIIAPSADRTEPVCPSFARCGGCQLMHMRYAAQLKMKEDTVENNLRRIGGFTDIPMEPISGMDEPYAYRNKMIFPVGQTDDGEPVCGFYAPRSHRIVPVQHCRLGDAVIQKILTAVTGWMKRYYVPAYDEQKHTGLIRRVFIRTGYHTGQVMVVISANGRKIPHKDELILALCAVSDRICSIIWNINGKRTNLVLGAENALLWGNETIEDELCGLRYRISPHSFFQINPVQTEKLYAKAVEFAQLTGKETVMDIYCGIGTISLVCAKQAKQVIGVEIVEQAVRDAERNAMENNIENAVFYADSAENIVPKLLKNGQKPDVVILDPPRKGSDAVTLEAIVNAQPQKIVYVSCDSATLARDLRVLAASGYHLEKAAPFDLFPQTVHVECVVLMIKEEKLCGEKQFVSF